MNLEEFVIQTLQQVINGVSKAQDHAMKEGAYINAPTTNDYETGLGINKESLPEPTIIEFDIAVTTTDNENIKGGMGIFVAGFGIGYQGTKGSSGSEISRIKFSIPVILPAQTRIQGE